MNIKISAGEVLLAIRPSVVRRWISILAMLAVSGIFLYGGFGDATEGFVWRSFLVLMGLGLLVLAWRFYHATALTLELTREMLREKDGRILFQLKDVVRVDRGAFSMKPSNGLSIHLTSRAPFSWEPGLWWRYGKRVGIGGATAPSQAKAIADMISLLEAERKGVDEPTRLI